MKVHNIDRCIQNKIKLSRWALCSLMFKIHLEMEKLKPEVKQWLYLSIPVMQSFFSRVMNGV